MCAGACVLARVDRLVYGALDPKAGMSGSLASLPDDPRLNHRVDIVRGVRRPDAARSCATSSAPAEPPPISLSG